MMSSGVDKGWVSGGGVGGIVWMVVTSGGVTEGTEGVVWGVVSVSVWEVISGSVWEVVSGSV